MTPSSLIPRTKLFGNPTRAQAQISPDGRWLSWLAPKDASLAYAIANIACWYLVLLWMDRRGLYLKA